MFYVYRCTTDKLEHHLNRITSSGDSVFAAQFLGGRDWVIIGRQSDDDEVRTAAGRLVGGQ